jgi:hypothetical protein
MFGALEAGAWLSACGVFAVRRVVGSLGCGILLVCACTEIGDLPPAQTVGTQSQAGIGGGKAASGSGGAGLIAGRSGSGATAANAGRGGATSGGAPQPTGEGLGAVGASCAAEKPKACVGPVSTGTLVCTNGKWAAGPQCAATERCDTAPGDTQGTCLPMLNLCSGKKPGDMICDAYTRRKCGNDLVRFEAFACQEHAHCEAFQGAVNCACDLNYKSDGVEACVPDVACPLGACSPGGQCVVGAADYSCVCDVEFGGTGTKDCVAVGRCAEATVCNADYVCRSKDLSYVCRGQFADWPMPSTSVGAKTPPNYMPTDETVADVVTGLTWQRNLPETYPGCAGTCTWDKAKAYCDALALAGADNWRLPAMIELVSILDDNAVMPSIDAATFPNTPSENFWSASPNAGDSTQAWGVGFAAFQILARAKTDSLRVRCVR